MTALVLSMPAFPHASVPWLILQLAFARKSTRELIVQMMRSAESLESSAEQLRSMPDDDIGDSARCKLLRIVDDLPDLSARAAQLSELQRRAPLPSSFRQYASSLVRLSRAIATFSEAARARCEIGWHDPELSPEQEEALDSAIRSVRVDGTVKADRARSQRCAPAPRERVEQPKNAA